VREHRILVLTHNYIRSKKDYAGLFLHTLFKGIALKGHNVAVLAPHEKGLPSFEIMDRVRVFRFRYGPSFLENLAYGGEMQNRVMKNPLNMMLFFVFLVSFLSRSLALAKRDDVDVISSQWWIPGGLVGWMVSLLSNKPLFVTLHGTDLRILKGSKLFRPLARKIFKRAKGVTCVSSFLRDYLAQSGLIEKGKVKILPMPVDAEKFKPQKLSEKAKKTILCVARFTRQKGLDYLIQAARILLDRKFDCEVKMVGGGPEKSYLQQRVEELGLSERVFLLDGVPQEDLCSLYAEADVVVLPSVEEGFGLVLVEAQLCRRPVIGTDSGGIPDIIQDKITGLLVKPKDALALAEAIEKVLVDRDYAERLAEKGYFSALSRFSPDAIQEKFVRLIEED